MDCPFPKMHPSQLVRDDAYYMQLAYNQAVDAWREDEVPIGAVIVHTGKIIAAAHNAVESLRDPTAHAEILALTQAARSRGDWRLNGAVLYATKEPCPMCAGAALMSRIDRVVYALPDLQMGCLGSACNLANLPYFNGTLTHDSKVLEIECRQLIQTFCQKKRLRPTRAIDG